MELCYEFDHLTHNWQNRFRLEIDRLSLHTAGSYALMGANGSGKSTLLRILAERFSKLDSLNAAGAVAYLPQKAYAFDLSVRNNIRLGIPAQSGLSKIRQDELIDEQMEQLGLTALANAKGHKLSGGEAQRVSLARLLVIPRKVLLLDEPTNALDLNGLARTEQALAVYRENCGCLMVLIAHHLRLAQRLCDHLIFLNQGHLDAFGPFSQMLRPPKTSELARFMYYEQPVDSKGEQ